MKYVSRVESTLKKGCACDLGPKTLIVGPNGSGKTTILQAITLAACGFAIDVEERSEAHLPHVLARLFPEEGPKFAKIELTEDDPQQVSAADQTTFEWVLETTAKGGAKKPPPAPMALHFPVQAVLAKLLGSPDTVRAWLASVVCAPLTVEQVKAKAPPAAREAADAFMKRHKSTDLLALAKLAGNEATERKRRAETKTETIDRMMQGVAAPLLDDRRTELDELVESLAQQLTSTAGGFTPDQAAALNQKIEAAQLQADELTRQVDLAQRDLSNIPRPDPAELEADARVGQLFSLLREHVKTFGDAKCAVCGNTDATAIPARVDLIVAHMEQMKARPQWAAAANRVQALQLQLDATRAELEQLFAKKANTPVVALAADRGRIQQELQDAQRRVAEDDAAKRAWTNHEAGRLEVEQLLDEVATLTKLKKMFERLGKVLLQEQKEEFEARVSFFLPDRVDCRVDLDTGRIGTSTDGGPMISTLSGGQGVQLLFALAEVVAGSGGSTPSVLIPPDRAWSGDTLGATMRAMSESNHQVILTSTVEPDGEVPGWTVVRLGKPASE